MKNKGLLFQALGVQTDKDLKRFSELAKVSIKDLQYYNENRLLPIGKDMHNISLSCGISPSKLALKMGLLGKTLEDAIAKNADKIWDIIQADLPPAEKEKISAPVFKTKLGSLFQGDCRILLKSMESESVDLVFADPPFNLNKLYPSRINDDLKADQYLQWCEEWLLESARILKKGGSLFIWNLPKWNGILARFLNGILTFKHWIATDIKYSLPISGRFYPSHYSLLYYSKGEKSKVFHPDRMPMAVCPKCFNDLVDYGGYKDKMNPAGVNLSDVWTDIPPVRHKKYKGRKDANELSIKLLDRIIESVTEEGDTVFDPFGGSGTTYIVAEMKKRKWLGIEIGPIDDIVERFKRIEKENEYLNRIRQGYNRLFTKDIENKRLQFGLWTCDTIRKKKLKSQDSEQIPLSFL